MKKDEAAQMREIISGGVSKGLKHNRCDIKIENLEKQERRARIIEDEARARVAKKVGTNP